MSTIASNVPPKATFNRQRLFVTSCISLITTAMIFAIRADVEKEMATNFHLTHEQIGTVWGPAFWAFTIAIFICGAVVDAIGMKRMHILSSIGYLVGLTMMLFAPRPTGPVQSIFSNTGTIVLYVGFFLMGLSQGLVEGVINPLVATIYSDNKTHRLNMLHAWWPGGLVIGGLLAFAMTQMSATWEMKFGLIYVPTIIYLILAITQHYPQTERVASNVSTGEMWSQAVKPLFILLFICMVMTASTELAPDQWFPTIMGDLVPAFKGGGVLFLVYTSGLMFVLRFYAGPLAHKLSPTGMLLSCAVFSAIGLFWLGSLGPGTSAVVAILAATVFAFGKSYFWPTMLGVTTEQFPRGGALLINLMGGVGMLSVSVALPFIGKLIGNGPANKALSTVAFLPLILIFIFGGLYAYFHSKGGYQAVRLATEEPIPAGEM